MKILITTDQIYMHGGIEKVMATKVNWWAAQPGIEVFIVTTEQQGKPPCYPLDSRVNLVDLKVNYIRSSSYFASVNLRKAVAHFIKQKKCFRDIAPDVIISPNINFDHYWLPFVKGKAILIKERHGSRFYETELRENGTVLQKLRLKINDWVERSYDHIVVLNPDEKMLVKTGNAVVIPNPVEVKDIDPPVPKKQVIAAGRISPVKGFERLIEAWALLPESLNEWELHFYGQDYLGTQKKLEEQIDRLGLGGRVIFKGSVGNLSDVLGSYSMYAMTSYTECFPMVLLESLAAGVPVVAFDCPTGPRHIVTHESDGLLVTNGNIIEFAEALINLMNNEASRKEFAAAAKENVKRFSLPQIMRQWSNLLNLSDV